MRVNAQDRQMQRQSLGAVLRTLREAEGLSRKELSTRSEVGPEMVAKIEQGVKYLSSPALRRLAEALGMEPSVVLERANAWQLGLQSGERPALLRNVALGSALAGRDWVAGGALAMVTAV